MTCSEGGERINGGGGGGGRDFANSGVCTQLNYPE